MAKTFNGTSDELSSTDVTAKVTSAAAVTIAGWIYRATAGLNLELGFWNDTTRFAGVTWYNSDNRFYASVGNGGLTYGATTPNAGTGWHQVTMVFDGSQGTNAGRLVLYVDGVAQTLSFTGTIPATLAAAPGTFRVGRNPAFARWSNGRHAEAAVWTAPLTAAEAASLAAGFSPAKIRAGSLVSYLPLIETVQDIKGNAWTTVGTTAATHPRVLGR